MNENDDVGVPLCEGESLAETVPVAVAEGDDVPEVDSVHEAVTVAVIDADPEAEADPVAVRDRTIVKV